MKRNLLLIKKFFQKIGRGNKKPRIFKKLGFGFCWDNNLFENIDEPIIELDTNEILWNMDLPFWEEEKIDDWNLTPREVIQNPEYYPDHYQRILSADLSYPICIAKSKNGKWFVLDGTHRLAKAYINNLKTIKVKIIPDNKLLGINKK